MISSIALASMVVYAAGIFFMWSQYSSRVTAEASTITPGTGAANSILANLNLATDFDWLEIPDSDHEDGKIAVLQTDGDLDCGLYLFESDEARNTVGESTYRGWSIGNIQLFGDRSEAALSMVLVQYTAGSNCLSQAADALGLSSAVDFTASDSEDLGDDVETLYENFNASGLSWAADSNQDPTMGSMATLHSDKASDGTICTMWIYPSYVESTYVSEEGAFTDSGHWGEDYYTRLGVIIAHEFDTDECFLDAESKLGW